ncbi:UDP-N-acetylmuramoyl-L-alanyl-D-glutamate--2,6-diaminopimelate ligase [Thorsellia anophelis]|uniref:UDP-N-acetylmuramoyl-L-alanyl-D-glutamate--2,6-diaminopimelate ligase n=1 Tax=Thorsellia anophelis DSM 18579 TaxID=1123402 RepID=A0A1H9ZC49_9GAMM|nr:UDP-N-acetylmuramoyl-L-alanyl-D-glutamate--2,6-diaminopimelate ligase [Thorsellia anophelis]SES79134.1 UDP-N-acetylmuramoylalanyl-D-glutamate--2,6-diaminopimelate ligase [Thorsellia anophelis DSM 18579]
MNYSPKTSMKLLALIDKLELKLEVQGRERLLQLNTVIEHLTLDSRDATHGSLFFAVPGTSLDGRNFIGSAIEQGASAIFIESATDKVFEITWHNDTPLIEIPNLTKRLSEIVGYFYSNSSLEMKCIGITGTNGKTTTSQLVAMWVSLLNQKAAVMGTIGNGLFGELTASNNTTPSALDIQFNLSKYNDLGAALCAMEVSSHGLVQHRVESICFDAVAFLNLSRDHLDYHGTMIEYEAAKFRLFNELSSQHKIINIDDAIGERWFKLFPEATAVSLEFEKFSKTVTSNFVFAKSIHYHQNGADIELVSSYGKARITSQLLGEFNVTNLLSAMAILLSIGYEFDKLVSVVHLLKPVAGRMEVFAKPNKATVVVDYAHTPDALEKALLALTIHQTGKLWCVFGCGGDRDKGKRPLMAAIAEQYADKVIVTDDNPRTENNTEITKDIEQGFLGTHYHVIHDRTDAIIYALNHAQANDIVLIAGKGHEDYQIIGHKKLDYSDRVLVSQLYDNKVGLA